MASGDLLRQLFREYAKRDDATFCAAAEAIIHRANWKYYQHPSNSLATSSARLL
jgi:hypothetical protein